MKSERGISLIELIMFIIIISVALVGILLVMNQVTKHSADPLVRKQAIAVAESLLEEVALQDFSAESGVAHATVTATNRPNSYHVVKDYSGGDFSAGTGVGVASINGATILANYSASVTVVDQALGSITAGSAVRITVTVTDPQNNTLSIDGYRTAY
ncbi:MAG: type II secretion system protein [Gallionellaceae bacterium]